MWDLLDMVTLKWSVLGSFVLSVKWHSFSYYHFYFCFNSNAIYSQAALGS